MSATVPPLAAMIRATRMSAVCPVCAPTALRWHIPASSAKAALSRVRAISSARPRRAGANPDSHARPGRMTSAQINTSNPGPMCAGRPVPPVRPVLQQAARSRQSGAASAPLAAQRSCQVSPAWDSSQLTTVSRP